MKIDMPADKAKHAVVGAIVALAAGSLFALLGWVDYWRSAAIGAALVAGIVKEVLDWLENRRLRKAGLAPSRGVEFADVVATLAGGLLIASTPSHGS